MNLRESLEFLDEQVTSAVAEWWRLATIGHPRLYLHYRPSSRATPGALTVLPADETREGWTVADPQYMPMVADRAQTFVWIMLRARRLPILPTR